MGQKPSGAALSRSSFGRWIDRRRDLEHAESDRLRWAFALLFATLGTVLATTLPIVGGDEFLRLASVYCPPAPGGTLTHDIVCPDGSIIPAGTTIIVDSPGYWTWPGEPAGLAELVTHNPAWLATTATLVVVISLFWVWRRSGRTSIRRVGVAISLATATALVTLTWPAARCAAAWLVAAPLLVATAFLVASPPRETSGER